MKPLFSLPVLLATAVLSGCVVNVAPSAQEDTEPPKPEKVEEPKPKVEEKPKEEAVPPPVVVGPGNLNQPYYPPPPPPPHPIGPGNL